MINQYIKIIQGVSALYECRKPNDMLVRDIILNVDKTAQTIKILDLNIPLKIYNRQLSSHQKYNDLISQLTMNYMNSQPHATNINEMEKYITKLSYQLRQVYFHANKNNDLFFCTPALAYMLFPDLEYLHTEEFDKLFTLEFWKQRLTYNTNVQKAEIANQITYTPGLYNGEFAALLSVNQEGVIKGKYIKFENGVDESQTKLIYNNDTLTISELPLIEDINDTEAFWVPVWIKYSKS